MVRSRRKMTVRSLRTTVLVYLKKTLKKRVMSILTHYIRMAEGQICENSFEKTLFLLTHTLIFFF